MGNSRVPEGGKSGVFPEFQRQKQRKGDKYLSKGEKKWEKSNPESPSGASGVFSLPGIPGQNSRSLDLSPWAGTGLKLSIFREKELFSHKSDTGKT